MVSSLAIRGLGVLGGGIMYILTSPALGLVSSTALVQHQPVQKTWLFSALPAEPTLTFTALGNLDENVSAGKGGWQQGASVCVAGCSGGSEEHKGSTDRYGSFTGYSHPYDDYTWSVSQLVRYQTDYFVPGACTSPIGYAKANIYAKLIASWILSGTPSSQSMYVQWGDSLACEGCQCDADPCPTAVTCPNQLGYQTLDSCLKSKTLTVDFFVGDGQGAFSLTVTSQGGGGGGAALDTYAEAQEEGCALARLKADNVVIDAQK